jgi:ketosteroid isomerase-like protein
VTPSDLFTATYRAFNARDIDAVLAVMAPDVDWPNGMDGSRMHGHQAVREYWTRQWSVIDPTVEPIRLTVDGDGRTVVDVHQVVRNVSGAIVADQVVQHVYELRDGLITRMEIRKP